MCCTQNSVYAAARAGTQGLVAGCCALMYTRPRCAWQSAVCCSGQARTARSARACGSQTASCSIMWSSKMGTRCVLNVGGRSCSDDAIMRGHHAGRPLQECVWGLACTSVCGGGRACSSWLADATSITNLVALRVSSSFCGVPLLGSIFVCALCVVCLRVSRVELQNSIVASNAKISEKSMTTD